MLIGTGSLGPNPGPVPTGVRRFILAELGWHGGWVEKSQREAREGSGEWNCCLLSLAYKQALGAEGAPSTMGHPVQDLP